MDREKYKQKKRFVYKVECDNNEFIKPEFELKIIKGEIHKIRKPVKYYIKEGKSFPRRQGYYNREDGKYYLYRFEVMV